MMNVIAAAGSLDVRGWIRGLVSAGVSGGASAITGGIVVSGLEPDNFNFHAGKFWELIGALFMVNAVVSIAKFLQNHPIPEDKDSQVGGA